MTKYPTAESFGLKSTVLYTAELDALRPYARNIGYGLHAGEQTYRQFLAVPIVDGLHAEQVWMVDTYHIDIVNTNIRKNNTDKLIESLLNMTKNGMASFWLNKVRYDFHYDDCVQLTDETANLFVPFVNLNEFKGQQIGERIEDYNQDDIRSHVHLCREHGYSLSRGDIGVTLVRKTAEPVPLSRMRRLHHDIRARMSLTFPFEYDMREIEEIAMQHPTPDVLDELETARRDWGIYTKMYELYQQSLQEYSDDPQLFETEEDN